MDTPVPPRRLRAMLVTGTVCVVILIMVWFIGDVIKWTGAPLLVLPTQLGLIRQVTPDQVLTIDMAPGKTSVQLPAPGAYVVYADVKQFLFTPSASDPKEAMMKWVTLTSGTTGSAIPSTGVKRGLMPYDTPFVPGRPVLTFAITAAGTYTAITPRRPATIAILPDYVTENERTIQIAMLLQLGVLTLALGSIAAVRYRKYRQRLQVVEARQQPRRAETETFWQTEIRRQQETVNKQRDRVE
jgi:hypothetical protein